MPLSLTRKVGEVVCIGPDVRIAVIGMNDGHKGVQLSIRAPQSVVVKRAEIAPLEWHPMCSCGRERACYVDRTIQGIPDVCFLCLKENRDAAK